MINEEEIAHFIIERIKETPATLGAQLGAVANARFPGVNFRLSYGGLREFLKKFGGPEIEIVRGQAGMDDIYRWRGAGAGAEVPSVGVPKTETPVATFPRYEMPWRIFTVPESHGRLYIHPESGIVQVVQDDDAAPEALFIEVPKLTKEEHRQIATDFLLQIDLDDRGRFQETLQAEDFWQKWFTTTRIWAGGKYLRPWLAYRFDRICDFFRQRLDALGISDSVAAICLERLKQSKAADRPNPVAKKRPPPISPTSDESLRNIARVALNAMSEEELRRLWLPLGVVADAVRRRDTQ